MRYGTIYSIVNDINGMEYIGQTCRDPEIRFSEHLWETRGHSKLHEAIQKYGREHFHMSVIERAPIDQLDEREIFWIKERKTQENGYNILPGGKNRGWQNWNKLGVEGTTLVFDSKEVFGEMLAEQTSWNKRTVTAMVKKTIEDKTTFLGYKFISLPKETLVSDPDTLADWIKTLQVRYSGTRIWSPNLPDMEFDSIGMLAKYLIDNGYYIGTSKMPVQSLTTTLGQYLSGKNNEITCLKDNFEFFKIPGTTKNAGGDFTAKAIYCPELDQSFSSQIEAARHFIDNGIWSGIKLKTAKLRISDVCRGVFPHYKGYTFVPV